MRFDNLLVMFDSILRYVDSHPGCEILPRDNPLHRMIGYFDNRSDYSEDSLWEIGLRELRNTIGELPPAVRDMVSQSLSSQQGRIRIANALSRGMPYFPRPGVKKPEPEEEVLRTSRYERIIRNLELLRDADPATTRD